MRHDDVLALALCHLLAAVEARLAELDAGPPAAPCGAALSSREPAAQDVDRPARGRVSDVGAAPAAARAGAAVIPIAPAAGVDPWPMADDLALLRLAANRATTDDMVELLHRSAREVRARLNLLTDHGIRSPRAVVRALEACGDVG